MHKELKQHDEFLPKMSNIYFKMSSKKFARLMCLMAKRSEVYSEPCQTSKAEAFAKTVDEFQPFTISQKQG